VAESTTATTTTLRWSAARDDAGIQGYVIRQDGEIIADLPASTTTFQVAGLAPESAYQFHLVAVDTDGNTSAELARAVQTESLPTDPGTALLTAEPLGGGVLLHWDPAAGHVSNYRVLRAVAGDDLVEIARS